MRRIFRSGSKWVWVFVLVLVGLLALGAVILPEVFRRGSSSPRPPIGLYITSLFTLILFFGVLISLAVERFERLMVTLFVGFRIGEIAWEYQLGRHSLWYLIGSVIAHLLIGSLVLLFLSGHVDRAKMK